MATANMFLLMRISGVRKSPHAGARAMRILTWPDAVLPLRILFGNFPATGVLRFAVRR